GTCQSVQPVPKPDCLCCVPSFQLFNTPSDLTQCQNAHKHIRITGAVDPESHSSVGIAPLQLGEHVGIDQKRCHRPMSRSVSITRSGISRSSIPGPDLRKSRKEGLSS